jgi:hypothetical protein
MKGESARDELQRDGKAVAAAGLVDAEVLELAGAGDVTYVVRARRLEPMRNGGRRSRRR